MLDTGFDFVVPSDLDAREPAEARGLARDQVRMLVGRRGDVAVGHHRFADLPQVLLPGDLLVVNNSATVPAALPGRLPDGTPVALHLSAVRPGPRGTHLVELRRPTAGAAEYYPPGTSPALPGLRVDLPAGATAVLTEPYTARLWYARLVLPGELVPYLLRHGKPIRYGYVDREWPLAAYQSIFGSEPGSSEMPSAARPFTADVLARLAARGILTAPITLHTGVASPEAHEQPYPEWYRVPETTSRLAAHVRSHGGRVIAVGTTAVRALESAATGTLEGWTDLVVTPERGVGAVDGLLTGWHEPRASHLLMLEAVAGRALLDLCYQEAIAGRYLWHEFGDVNLLLSQ
ncbi:S-adenosylmethionine:tRNA ribosyltransferase-isomerase [Kitasatospora sp. McL0602]|uniref:S-adenosylmethionine:tRNA ribosyltransferase-isomerase n=1 Tax=Kitasatospora sp. McL0602 TaxID=3439530 RepID=UPI003F8C2F65